MPMFHTERLDAPLTPAQKQRIKWWIEALESGYYKQGQNFLLTLTPSGRTLYCCLGVACEIYSASVGGFWKGDYKRTLINVHPEFVADYSSEIFGGEFEVENDSLPPEIVREWFGMSSDVQRLMADANDNGVGFAAISQALRNMLTTGVFSVTY